MVDMKQFCLSCSCISQYDLSLPFILDGWLYATDGHIAVRKRSDEPNTDGQFPRIIEDMFSHVDHTDMLAVPSCNIAPRATRCGDCGGIGKLSKCEECNGTGEVKCLECGHIDDCDECGGKGRISGGSTPCERCDNTGTIQIYPNVKLFGQWFDGQFIAKILTIPGVTAKIENGMLAFCNEEYFGLLMPITGPFVDRCSIDLDANQEPTP